MKRKALLKAFALLLLLLSCPDMRADSEAVKHLVITEKGGTETTFALSTNPVITIESNSLTVTTESESTITVSLADVASYNVQDLVPTGIEKAVATPEGIKTTMSDGKATISGLKEGAHVQVYTLDGKMVSVVKASADGNVTVNLSSLQNGTVYILKTPNASYKILNR
ncbi:MAG: hypothetical protein Q4D41_09175 [Prevotellaceae bacterium]|nr:hypothetical protein [Prevotellaceae bacterium]